MATNNAINQHKPFTLFFAYLSASTGAVTGDGTNVIIPFDSTLYNDGSFNTLTYTMTAPVTGIYLLNGGTLASNCNGKTAYAPYFIVNGQIQIVKYNSNTVTVSTNSGINMNLIVQMTATQTATFSLNVDGGAKDCAILSAGANDPRTWFSATLIG